MMTKIQAENLAAIVNTVRPDWDTRGILAALVQVRDRPLADVCAAAIRAAQQTTNRTPAVIPLNGPHWRPEPADRTPAPVRRTEQCHRHEGGIAGRCSMCASETKAGTTTETKETQHA